MTNEPSPRPWQISDPFEDGFPAVRDMDGRQIATMDGETPFQNEANAALIVDAVNEQESLHKQLAAFRQERDGLRKQVSAYLLELVKRSSINEALGDSLKRIGDICAEAWEAPERDREAAMSKALNDIYEIARGSRKEAAT